MLSELTDKELEVKLPELVHDERVSTVAVLEHLVELEKRELHVRLGFSSLFDYCRRKLKYSEGAATRRIQAAGCLVEFPELKEKLINGDVSLCCISTAASTMKAGKLKPDDLSGKSKREVEFLVAETRPVAVPPPVEKRVELRVTFAEKDYELLNEARNRLSNALGAEVTFEALFVRLAHKVVKPTVRVAKPTRGRHISPAVKLAVRERDGAQCTYVKNGTRCCAKRYLQFDHIVPFATGGGNDVDNLRLRCSKHNRLAAEQFYGKSKMDAYRKA